MPNLAELGKRDVVCLPLGGGRILLQSVDVAVGIGSAPDDVIEALSADVGYSVARTAAAELWSLGVAASIAAVAIAVRAAVEGVLEGVHMAFHEMGEVVSVVRSAENYVQANVSSVSVAVSGVAAEQDLLLGRPLAGHRAFLLGGGYTQTTDAQDGGRWPLASLSHLLQQREQLVQVVPVGSGGVGRDLEGLRGRHGLLLDSAGPRRDYGRPGGPGLQFLVIAEGTVSGPDLTPLGEFTQIGDASTGRRP